MKKCTVLLLAVFLCATPARADEIVASITKSVLKEWVFKRIGMGVVYVGGAASTLVLPKLWCWFRGNKKNDADKQDSALILAEGQRQGFAEASRHHEILLMGERVGQGFQLMKQQQEHVLLQQSTQFAQLAANQQLLQQTFNEHKTTLTIMDTRLTNHGQENATLKRDVLDAIRLLGATVEKGIEVIGIKIEKLDVRVGSLETKLAVVDEKVKNTQDSQQEIKRLLQGRLFNQVPHYL